MSANAAMDAVRSQGGDHAAKMKSLALVIERVTGMAFDAFLAENFFLASSSP